MHHHSKKQVHLSIFFSILMLISIVFFSCSKSSAPTTGTPTILGNCNSTTTGSLSGVGGGTVIYVPNAFTPNGDGINDTFKCEAQNVSSFNMTIKDVSGTVLFSTSNPKSGWDGKNKSGAIVEDYYTALFSFKDGTGASFSYGVTLSAYQYHGGCLTKNCSLCRFGDQIDPKLGFVYQTLEKVCP